MSPECCKMIKDVCNLDDLIKYIEGQIILLEATIKDKACFDEDTKFDNGMLEGYKAILMRANELFEKLTPQ